MVVLGLLLLALAGVVTALLATTLTEPTSASTILGISLEGLTLGGLFVSGVITGVVGMLGLSLVLRGLARSRRHRVERKRVVQEKTRTAAELEAENSRLAQQLDEERSRQHAGVTAYPEVDADSATAVYPDDPRHERTGLSGTERSER